MQSTDRVVLIDLENLVGTNPRPAALWTRIGVLLNAAGPHHHAVVAYAAPDADGDTVFSVLAALGVAPLRVEPGPDAAENALIRHAVRMQTHGCTRFTVCSSDRAFATLADAENTRLDILVWQGQPVTTRLADVAHSIRELPRPDKATVGAAPSVQAASDNSHDNSLSRAPAASGSRSIPHPAQMVRAVLVGVGVAVGQRLVDRVLPPRR
ncbi:MAG: hypothetical protein HOV94_19145 [Saccharothrix sp.]|nr:hypothetical protein [Saccharothrix sp.]